MNNGLFRGQLAGASENQADQGPRKPKDLAQEVSLVWDELRTLVHADAWRSSNPYLFQSLCELIVLARTLYIAACDQSFETKITSKWLAVVDKVCKLNAEFGLSPKSRTRMENDLDEFGGWVSNDRI